MFSWICPQCGRDVPPSKTDCPYCAEQAAALAAASPVAAGAAPEQQQAAPWQQPAPGYGAPPSWPPQPPPQYAPPQYAQAQYPPPQYPPQQPAYAPPPPPAQQAHSTPPPPPPYAQQQHHPAPPPPAQAWAPTPARSAPPTWLVGIGTFVVLLLIGGSIWYFVLRTPDGGASAKAASSSGSAATAAASTAKAASGAANPYQKYVEVVGLRMFQENKKPVVRFVVVNHSQSEIDNLQANVRVSASTSRSDEDAVGSFSFKVPELGANASKDLTEPLKTKMKMYELPDWQNATASVEITSPAQ